MSKYGKICDMLTLLNYAKNVAKCQVCGNRIFAFFLTFLGIGLHVLWSCVCRTVCRHRHKLVICWAQPQFLKCKDFQLLSLHLLSEANFTMPTIYAT